MYKDGLVEEPCSELVVEPGVEDGLRKCTHALRGNRPPSKGHGRAPEEKVFASCLSLLAERARAVFTGAPIPIAPEDSRRLLPREANSLLEIRAVILLGAAGVAARARNSAVPEASAAEGEAVLEGVGSAPGPSNVRAKAGRASPGVRASVGSRPGARRSSKAA